MSNKEIQARPEIALYQPEVDRQVVRLVQRGDTDHLVPGTHLTMDELHHYQLLGRRLQARAVSAAFASLFRGLAGPFKKLAAVSTRAAREAAAIRQLSALDDHLLADLGIRRGQIPAAVAGLMERPAARKSAPAASVEPLPEEAPAADNEAQAREAA